MSTLLTTMDELNKGLSFVRAASLAIRGSCLEATEVNAIDRVIDAAEEALANVKGCLEKAHAVKGVQRTE